MPSEVKRKPTINPRAYYIFLISALLFGLGQFHRLSGAVSIPPIAEDLNLAVDSLGSIAAVLFITSAVLQIPNGLLLDRYGPRRVAPLYVGVAVIGCFIMSFATTYEEVLISRMLLGGGFSVTMMSAYVLFAKWFPVDRFATIASWMMAASSLGSLLSSYPLAYFISEFGWRPAYWIVGGFTVLAILIAYMVIRDDPPGYIRNEKQPTTLMESIKGYMVVVKYPRFFFLLAMGTVAFGPSTTILGMWGGPYLDSTFGLNGIERGEILFLMVVAIPVGALCFGPLDRLFSSRKTVVFGAVACEIVAFSILGFAENLPLWAVTVLFILIAFLQQHYVLLAAQCRAAFPDYLVGRANSTLNMVSILGVGAMQYVFGFGIKFSPENGYRISFIIIALMLVVASILYIWSPEKQSSED
jgi:MFS family permease